MRKISKYRGVTSRIRIVGWRALASADRPSTPMFMLPRRLPTGRRRIAQRGRRPAPGVARARASNSSKKAAPCSAVGYLVRTERRGQRDDAFAVEAERHVDHVPEAPQQQRGAAEQRQRQRDLHGDQREPDARPRTRRRGARRAQALQPPARKTEIAGHRPIAIPVMTTSRTATTNTRTSIDASAMPGISGRRHRDERLQERECHEEPDTARRQPRAQAFGEREARESNLARADGGSDRELPLALGHAREHEVGDVHARDQQEDGHGADEQPGHARGVADPPVAQRLHFPGRSRVRWHGSSSIAGN